MASSRFRTIQVSSPEYTHDGLHFITVKTPHLRGRGDITVYLPDGEDYTAIPMVVLLHGVYGSHWAWALRGGVHRVAQRLMGQGKLQPMALVMPSDGLFGDGSGYLPHSSKDFESWIVEDVPAAVQEAFPFVQSQVAGMCITGLSMGGYGALRLGAKYPNLYRGFSGHSSITQLSELGYFVEEPLGLYRQTDPEEENILVQLVKNQNNLPPFRFDCGLDDNLLEANRVLHKALVAKRIAHTYEEYPGGHEWPYWTKHIESTLLFFNSLF